MNKRKILLVDDENFVCENVKLKLKRMQHLYSYEVIICNSAKQALIEAENQVFDIVITDIRMPFISGLTLIKELREKGFDNKIFVLSGYEDFEYVRSAFLAGADDYLLKPVDITALNEKLMKYDKPEILEEEPRGQESDVIEYALSYIEQHYSDPGLHMGEVAEHISLSYSHFSNLFRAKMGYTFPVYLLQIRVNKAISLLQDPSMKISDICYKVGFKYPQQFSRDFKKITGKYPSEYWKCREEEKECEGMDQKITL